MKNNKELQKQKILDLLNANSSRGFDYGCIHESLFEEIAEKIVELDEEIEK